MLPIENLLLIKAPMPGIYRTGASNVSAEHERILIATTPDMHLIHLKGHCHPAWILEPANRAKHMLEFIAYHDRRNIRRMIRAPKGCQ